MKGLTLKASWAWAVIHAGKDIENRSWKTKIRGRIAIHASSNITRKAYHIAMTKISVYRWKSEPLLPKYEDILKGVIIGSVEIVDCVRYSDSKWFEGSYGFVLANPVPLKSPIPFTGKLGFWNVPEDIEKQLI